MVQFTTSALGMVASEADGLALSHTACAVRLAAAHTIAIMVSLTTVYASNVEW